MLRPLFLCLMLLPVAALADAPKLVISGELTWGSSPTFIPFEFMQDGKATGFDVDLVADLSKRIGLKSNMLSMDFGGIIPAMLGGRIDAGVSGLYVTPARLQAADFIPYVIVGNQIVVRAGNPKHVADQHGLCGLNVAVPVSTAFEASAKALSAECVAANKPAINLLSLPGSTNVALALAQGRADAALNSTATVAAMMAQDPDTYELAGPPFDANTKIGIALRKDDPELTTELNKALQAMHADGTYDALLKKWKLPPQASIF